MYTFNGQIIKQAIIPKLLYLQHFKEKTSKSKPTATMTPFVLAIVWMCNVLTFVNAVPLPAVEHNRELDMLQIPVSNGKEIDVLTLGSKEQEVLIAERNKRTIGLLRELFPDITKQIDSIVNRIIAQVIRVAGPDLLRSVLSNRPSSQRPNLAADFDDDDDDSDDNNNNNINKVDNEVNDNNRTAENDNEANTRIQIELPTFSPGSQEELSTTTTVSTYNDNDNVATDTQIDLTAINKQLEETIRVARQIKEAEAAAEEAAAAVQEQQSQLKSDDTIQLSFNNEVSSLIDEEKTKNINNNELQLSESKSPALDDLALDSSEDAVDLDDRNKRFLPLASGTNSAGDNTGGAVGAGSGNFLFDVVRLFSGSVQTQTGDANANSVSGSSDSDSDIDANRANDGYTEGIPGPVTRLVVLANRGLANLIQDLILRVAATSEKFVNFKAKLITALI
uniref:Uncharacterized protein n=1 Tax=Glossina brevipalpis TaxID=37001 RepID=A0A1A9X0C2_9MUSC